MKKSVVILPGLVSAAMALIIGCGGGSGSSTSSVVPTGKSALHYGVLSSYHSLAAGMGFPNRVLRMVAPPSSKIGTSPVIPLDLPSLASFSKRGSRTIDYDPVFNLYFTEVETGNSEVVSFFSDAGASHAVGTMTVTTSGPTLVPTTFPATINGKISLTGGNIPMNGTCKLVMSSATGSNQLTGSLNLPNDGLTFQANMSLSPSLQVGGIATVAENGQTISASQISGQLDGDLTCHATLQPGNYSGTGTLNFPNATMSLSLSSGSESVNGTVNSGGGLTLTYSDGSKETVTDPITAKITGGNGSSTTGSTTSGSTTAGSSAGTGGTSGFGSYTLALMPSTPSEIISVAPTGQMVGEDVNGAPAYWSTPMGTSQAITPDPKSAGLFVTAVNSKGHILGVALDTATSNVVPLFYTSPTSAPLRLPVMANNTTRSLVTLLLNSNDVIAISGYLIAGTYESPTSTTLVSPNDPVAGVAGLLGISDVGSLLGFDGADATELWTSVPATGVPIELGQFANAAVMGLNGTVAANYAGGNGVVKIAVPKSYGLTTLATPAGMTGNLAYSVGPTGNILGDSYTESSKEGVLWKTPSAPIVFGTQGTVTITDLLYQTSSGVIIAFGHDGKAPYYQGYYVLTPK